MFRLTPLHRGWFDDVNRSHSLFDQVFGQALCDEDLTPRLDYYPAYAYYLRSRPEGQIQPMRPTFDRQRSGLSRVTNARNEFKVCLDVQQFKPEEVTVKTVDNFVLIEAKHEEKEDEHGYIQRHFIRKYLLPEGVKPETVKCSLSSDGVLAITAPKQAALKEPEERVVPITQSPYPAVQQGSSGKDGAASADTSGDAKSSSEKQEA